MLENYAKILNIEANCMIDMVKRQILPACMEFAGKIAFSHNQLAQSGVQSEAIIALTERLAQGIDGIHAALSVLEQALDKAHHIAAVQEDAVYYRDAVYPAMQSLRACVDEIETIVSSDAWPMPNYTDLLHRV